MTSIFNRARIHELGYDGFVLSLSQLARAAFIEGVFNAEGNYATNTQTQCIAQNKGKLFDAICLCAYLCGHRPTVSRNGERNMVATLSKSYVIPRRLNVANGRIENVWCPSTTLGTWTMRSNGYIVLTGNTETVRQGVDGFRCRTMAEFEIAANRLSNLDPGSIRLHAQDTWSTEVIGQQYEEHFSRLMTLWGDGFYSRP